MVSFYIEVESGKGRFITVILNEKWYYIKLTISKMANSAICISFHKAEFPIEFPLKD
ncbi:hypothetical protein JCM19301_263 [Jejuia pallidilutea]|uniref:Uncharacterized protein n=1 Tax=Jejuia pallidilutea TaxID=504487 RepID=A0A090VWF2_9FLAO|nr:hypothetical protein JCM19301_263 [Jejuia pallidilutea]GAL70202.1 hypothetical protein JCM19302_2777 [Jejuia pallidilutea]GAL88841.1 hypothetical protein JCM19538_1830 [Jejuia pallidilutea]